MKVEMELPINTDYDVIVAGGGPAGCAAAAAAARDGAKTLLIESTGCLGGMGTSGLVPAWVPFSDGERIIYGGIAERIFSENKKGILHVKPEDTDWVPIDSEALKRQYDELLEEFGAEVLFNTCLSGVKNDGNGNVEYIITTNKKGLSCYKSKIYIDCTGDADLAVWAGAEYKSGDENGELQPASHCFILSNVDEYAYTYGTLLYPYNKSCTSYALQTDNDFECINDTHLCDKLIGPGTVGFNAGHIWAVDNTDPASVSKGLILGRKIAAQYKNALAKHHPAFANAHLISTANLIGIRETRRIVGDYSLSLEDFLSRRSFEDEISRNCYYIDIHNTPAEVQKKIDENFNPDDRYERYKKGESHGIPYRCLIPGVLNNLLVAGRSISADRIVQGSTRVMPVCLNTGEAAGCAAAMAMVNGNVRSINVSELQNKLKKYGGYLPSSI